MDERTAAQLADINHAFYARRAQDFSDTRLGAWPGWTRLARVMTEQGFPADGRVLDVGCGNGRLGHHLAESWPGLHYTGLDACEELVAIAEQRGGLGASPAFVHADLVRDDLAAKLGDARFDLIACFGLLHHVPGRARRRALLETLLGRLTPRGLLAVTCWRAASFQRFADKIVPWSEAELAVDETQLEPGDHLLPFGDGDGLRYVHFAHQDETAELLAELGVTIVDAWQADGKTHALNQYFVVRPAG